MFIMVWRCGFFSISSNFRNSAEEKWARQIKIWEMTIQCVGHVRPQTAVYSHQMHHVVVIGAAWNDWTSFLIVFVGFVHFFNVLFRSHRCWSTRHFVTFVRTTFTRFPLACDIAWTIVRLRQRQCVFVRSRPFHISNRVFKFDLIVFCIPFRAHPTTMRGVNCEWNEEKCVVFADFMNIVSALMHGSYFDRAFRSIGNSHKSEQRSREGRREKARKCENVLTAANTANLITTLEILQRPNCRYERSHTRWSDMYAYTVFARNSRLTKITSH